MYSWMNGWHEICLLSNAHMQQHPAVLPAAPHFMITTTIKDVQLE
jgi:hypothetical protein